MKKQIFPQRNSYLRTPTFPGTLLECLIHPGIPGEWCRVRRSAVERRLPDNRHCAPQDARADHLHSGPQRLQVRLTHWDQHDSIEPVTQEANQNRKLTFSLFAHFFADPPKEAQHLRWGVRTGWMGFPAATTVASSSQQVCGTIVSTC